MAKHFRSQTMQFGKMVEQLDSLLLEVVLEEGS